MAIGRLLSPKLNHHFSSRGFVPLTRRWVSSFSPEDGRKLETLSDSKASANEDIGKKGMDRYSFGGFLTDLKQKIIGNMLFINKTSGEDSVSPKSPMVSSGDVTATKVVSLQNVAEPSVKDDTSVSEIGSQDAPQNVAGSEISRKSESTSVEKERLDNNSLGGSEFSQEKVLRLVQAERVETPEEPSFKDVSLGLSTAQLLESLASPGKNQRKLQLSNMFINRDPEKEVKLPMRFEALRNSNSSSDAGNPVQKIKNISKENEKQRFPDALQKPESWASFLPRGLSHDQKSEDLSRKVMDSLNLQTDKGTVADANSWNPNGGERKAISNGSSVTNKNDRFCATEEEVPKGETLVMQNQSLCSQATLAATTANPKLTEKSLDLLSIGNHSPNKVVLRFLEETCTKNDIVEYFSGFGAILDVQELPSFKGCIYKDALLTFETDSAVKKALKKAVVTVKHFRAIVEATSQEDMVESICIPGLIGDPDVPIALVKKPTRTVKIHPLERDITSNQIKQALGFCRSGISKFIMGSSKTAAFVEFKTEDDKDRALAEHSICIFNKQLFISRIDVPRTTVARISNFSACDIRSLCVPYGQIKKVTCRGKGIVDVHFDVSEWPNMLTILNSLNGMEIDGMKWVVRPAPVIPHEILRVLWKDPQEKRYVKGLIQNMVREIEQPLDASHISAFMYSTF
ncbi:unnamed protein product [Arabis nemorensis]|uniref:RRM domain-containing protein n=1 Tax=Arabis nemorensis TaxID=586526 RepID=A0A565BB55_9BRAS|nr:unnamed protein product [Arabis nemorensis]